MLYIHKENKGSSEKPLQRCITNGQWLSRWRVTHLVRVYLATQIISDHSPKDISNSQRIPADSARIDWSKAVQANSVQVPKNWGLVRARSKNFSDWIGLDLDGPGPDWSIAGLVESLIPLPEFTGLM